MPATTESRLFNALTTTTRDIMLRRQQKKPQQRRKGERLRAALQQTLRR